MVKIKIGLVVTGLIIFSACVSMLQSVANTKLNTEIIPSGFDPKRHTILVAEMPKLNSTVRHVGITNKLEKIFKKNYPYKYEIASIAEITETGGKYSDTSIYKYAVLNSLWSYEHMTTTTIIRDTPYGRTTTTMSPSSTFTSIDFRFYDRTLKKEYPVSGNNSNFMKIPAEAFIQIIIKRESER